MELALSRLKSGIAKNENWSFQRPLENLEKTWGVACLKESPKKSVLIKRKLDKK